MINLKHSKAATTRLTKQYQDIMAMEPCDAKDVLLSLLVKIIGESWTTIHATLMAKNICDNLDAKEAHVEVGPTSYIQGMIFSAQKAREHQAPLPEDKDRLDGAIAAFGNLLDIVEKASGPKDLPEPGGKLPDDPAFRNIYSWDKDYSTLYDAGALWEEYKTFKAGFQNQYPGKSYIPWVDFLKNKGITDGPSQAEMEKRDMERYSKGTSTAKKHGNDIDAIAKTFMPDKKR